MKNVTLPNASPTHWLWQPKTQQWQPAEAIPFEAMHGLMLGYSVFTTFRTPQGPCWLRVHLQRVLQHAKRIQLQPLAPISSAIESISPILAKHPKAVFRLTAMFSGDASTLSHALNPLPTIWLLHLRAEAVEAFPSTPPASSLRLKTVAFEQAVPQLKHGALLPAWLVKRQALQIASAVDEIIWQAPTGELLETTTGNLFFFMADGTLRTAEAEKVLSGITRQQVKKVCQQDVLPLIEQAIHWQSEATQVMGAFTTNSVKGLVAVESLNGVALNWDAKTLDQWHTLYTAWLASLGLEGCYRTL